MTICTECGEEYETEEDWEDYGFFCPKCWERLFGFRKDIEFEPDTDWED